MLNCLITNFSSFYDQLFSTILLGNSLNQCNRLPFSKIGWADCTQTKQDESTNRTHTMHPSFIRCQIFLLYAPSVQLVNNNCSFCVFVYENWKRCSFFLNLACIFSSVAEYWKYNFDSDIVVIFTFFQGLCFCSRISSLYACGFLLWIISRIILCVCAGEILGVSCL